MADFSYDVSDYVKIYPVLSRPADMDALIDAAHRCDLSGSRSLEERGPREYLMIQDRSIPRTDALRHVALSPN